MSFLSGSSARSTSSLLAKLGISHFQLGLLAIWLLALALRFWGLSRFNTLVFDEVYFARYGNNYVAHTPFFDSHPPLGKYMIGLGIWLAGKFDPWGYRWINALVGSLIPLLVAGISLQLSKRQGFALLAGLFTAADGLLLVESRYGLINIHLLFWGLLGQWLLLLALQAQKYRWLGLLLAGAALGAAVAVKWNSLGFILGVYLTWAIGILIYRFLPASRHLLDIPVLLPLQFLRRLSVWHLGLTLPITFVLVYLTTWIPHWLQNQNMGFWQLQLEMYDFHKRVGNGPQVHAYCSAWYTWPWMVRPVSYFFQRATSLAEPMPVIGPPLPVNATKFVYDVHAMGNPFLWWPSTLAILGMVGLLIWYLGRWLGRTERGSETDLMPVLINPVSFWLPLFLVVNYVANLLPWVTVKRCLFLYHYMPASVYSFMALAWFVFGWLQSPQKAVRAGGVTVIFLILLAFVFWLPIYLGLPLTEEAFRWRMWFPSWI